MTTTVINIKDAPADWLDRPDEFVYIGRKGKGLKGTFGNPYRVTKGDEKGLGLSLKAFRSYMMLKLNTDIEFFEQVMDLHGKTLVCFCKPKPCHGDVIAEWVNGMYGEIE